MKKDSLTNNDILDFVDKLDKIITEFDEVSYSIYNNKQNALRFIKKINDITYITVIVISNRHQTFRVQTVYILKKDFLKIQNKKENGKPSFNVQALNQTSKTNGLTSFYEQILAYLKYYMSIKWKGYLWETKHH